jgi:hypothetical protein
MVTSHITTMKIRNRNGRTHAAFSAFDKPLSGFSSATFRSLNYLFGGKLTRWINTGKRVFCGTFATFGRENGVPRAVMPGLDPGHPRLEGLRNKDMDGRNKPGMTMWLPIELP